MNRETIAQNAYVNVRNLQLRLLLTMLYRLLLLEQKPKVYGEMGNLWYYVDNFPFDNG